MPFLEASTIVRLRLVATAGWVRSASGDVAYAVALVLKVAVPSKFAPAVFSPPWSGTLVSAGRRLPSGQRALIGVGDVRAVVVRRDAVLSRRDAESAP